MPSNEKIRPIRDFVLVQPLDEPEKTNSGLLYVPKSAKGKELRAKVLATGPGRYLECGKLIEPSVKVGDTILALEYRMESSNGFQDIGRGEKPPVIIPEGDIIAVIEVGS